MAKHTEFTVVKLNLDTITFDNAGFHIDSESRINQFNYTIYVCIFANTAIDCINYLKENASIRIWHTSDNDILHRSPFPDSVSYFLR